MQRCGNGLLWRSQHWMLYQRYDFVARAKPKKIQKLTKGIIILFFNKKEYNRCRSRKRDKEAQKSLLSQQNDGFM